MQKIKWKNDREFTVGGVTFYCALDDYSLCTNGERFVLLKDRTVLENYSSVFRDSRPSSMLEFGIFQGGSPALFAFWFELEKFVGVDICEPLPEFDAFCKRDAHGARIKSYYRVSQTDRARVEAIILDEFGATGPEVIIDDASHTYSATRRTFEISFPHLRRGGTYVIEDWGWAHWPGSKIYAGKTAMSMLVMELMMLCASRSDIVSEVRVFPSVAFISKAPDAPLLNGFTLDGSYTKRGVELIAAERPKFGRVAAFLARALLRRG